MAHKPGSGQKKREQSRLVSLGPGPAGLGRFYGYKQAIPVQGVIDSNRVAEPAGHGYPGLGMDSRRKRTIP
jgi:hypothetical protein